MECWRLNASISEDKRSNVWETEHPTEGLAKIAVNNFLTQFSEDDKGRLVERNHGTDVYRQLLRATVVKKVISTEEVANLTPKTENY
jgi:hypothetical protein